ncbi:MAG: hypothetical protein ACOYIH_00180 [Candidatus Fimadaptatus sp.]|jgi:hypothetical protein
MKRVRLMCLFLSIIMLIPTVAFGASNTNEGLASSNRTDRIIRYIAAQNGFLPDELKLVPIISGVVNSGVEKATNYGSYDQYALEHVSIDVNGLITVTTIIPLVEAGDGSLVNSFSYVPSGGIRPMASLPVSDMTIELKSSYKQFPSAIKDTFHAYQLYNSSFRWTKSSSSTSSSKITYAKIYSCVAGQLYSNPSSGTPTLKNSNFSKERTKEVTNPEKSTWKPTPTVMTSSDGIVYCSDAINHGGWAYVDFKYLDANGNSRGADFSAWCFRK